MPFSTLNNPKSNQGRKIRRKSATNKGAFINNLNKARNQYKYSISRNFEDKDFLKETSVRKSPDSRLILRDQDKCDLVIIDNSMECYGFQFSSF